MLRKIALTVAALALPLVPVLSVGPASAAVDPGTGTAYSAARTVVPIVFPVLGSTSYSDNFLACRSGCVRMHMGQDLMGPKMSPLVAAFDGVVTSLSRDGRSGNYVVITADRGAAKGWSAMYLHVNNDTPGTDDGRGSAAHAFPRGIEVGSRVVAGQLVAWRGDSGNAEGTGPHLHFELRKGDGWSGTVYNAFPSLQAGRRLSTPLPSGPHPDGSLVRHPNGSYYLLEGGYKRPISRAVMASNDYSAASAIRMTAAESLLYPAIRAVVPRDGSALVRVGSGTVHRIEAGWLRPFSPGTTASWGLQTSDVKVLAELPDLPLGAPIGLRDGTLVSTAGSAHQVGVVSGGTFRRIWDTRQVNAYGYAGKPRLLVTASAVSGLRQTELTSRY